MLLTERKLKFLSRFLTPKLQAYHSLLGITIKSLLQITKDDDEFIVEVDKKDEKQSYEGAEDTKMAKRLSVTEELINIFTLATYWSKKGGWQQAKQSKQAAGIQVIDSFREILQQKHCHKR